MKKFIIFLFLLTSCSFNSNTASWKENLNSSYQELKYDEDYTFDEYEKILDRYNERKKIPKLN
jgi:ABC-type amino acid transport substrate-binding protein